MISVTAIELFLNGDRLRFFPILEGPPSEGAGDGDLEVDDKNDLRAILRSVPVTDLLGPFTGSLASRDGCPAPVLVGAPFSSEGRLNFAVLNLFFAFLDALRNSSLFATYPVPLALAVRSGGKERMFSE